MRYPASEKLEIIGLVERSHLPAKQTLDRLGIARPTFYRWYDLYLRFGEDALEDRRPGPRRGWNRIPDNTLKAKTFRRQNFKYDPCAHDTEPHIKTRKGIDVPP